ncbi:hypothetical protein PTUN_a1523 [Pseudoalteromonas tunicata]|jgi:hypothetical protein|nr:hypothetical protein PTUN_a1523 [Pseudoalteromonas tunicata]
MNLWEFYCGISEGFDGVVSKRYVTTDLTEAQCYNKVEKCAAITANSSND